MGKDGSKMEHGAISNDMGRTSRTGTAISKKNTGRRVPENTGTLEWKTISLKKKSF